MAQSLNNSEDAISEYHWLKFENRRLTVCGNEYQRLFEDIMVRLKPGFTRIRPYGSQGDLKCDGLFRAGGEIYQVYSPDEIKQAQLVAKVEEDLEGAILNWGEEIQKWIFVYNVRQGLPPDIPKILEKKKKTISRYSC